MDTFPPAYTDYLKLELSGEDDNKVVTAQFGDGYRQVGSVGINPNPQRFPLAFDGLDETEFDNLRTWLKAHMTAQFTWTPPMPSATAGTYRVVGKLSWSRNMHLFRLSVTFQEEF